MCIFSGPVKEVSATQIFISDLGGNKRGLVYKMAVECVRDVAMILPLPVLHDGSEDAVKFLDFGSYTKFFDDLDTLFPSIIRTMKSGSSRSRGSTRKSMLIVHDVGNFIASYVPTLVDFERLDERFRLSQNIWDRLPYRNYGFAVFQLKPGNFKVHPMALSYQTTYPDKLFFPAVHVHDGLGVPEYSDYDHTLYYQLSGVFGSLKQSQPLIPNVVASRDNMPPSTRVAIERTHGLVDPIYGLEKMIVKGVRENTDFVLTKDVDSRVQLKTTVGI